MADATLQDRRKKELVRELKVRRTRMDSDFAEWSPQLRDVQKWVKPSRGRFDGLRPRSTPRNIIDATARRGLRTLSSGLMAGMTSPSRPWFKIKSSIDALEQDHAAKLFCDTVEKRMYEVLRGSNVYQMLRFVYDDLGQFGTFGGMMTADFEDVLRGHAFHMGTYRLAVSEGDRVDHLHRTFKMSVGAMVRKFGYDALPQRLRNSYDNNRIHEEEDVCHAVEPRLERDPLSPLSINKPYASVYYLPARDWVLQESGYSVNPIIAPRWEMAPGEAWSTDSPGMEALGDARQLQGQHIDKAKATQKAYDPPLMGAVMQGHTYRNIPGGVTPVSTNDLRSGGLRPIYEVNPDTRGLREDIAETQRRIEDAFFVPLFLMLSQVETGQKTAFEVARLQEEKILMLGPVLESLDRDLLTPLIELAFHYMQEADLLPEPPESMVGSPVKVEYVSALAQAQKAVGVAPIERTVGMVGTLANFDQTVMDVYDVEQALRDFSEQVGAPASHLRAAEKVAEMRAERAQRQQAEQAIAAAPQLAQSANLIAQASERGADQLARNLPL